MVPNAMVLATTVHKKVQKEKLQRKKIFIFYCDLTTGSRLIKLITKHVYTRF